MPILNIPDLSTKADSLSEGNQNIWDCSRKLLPSQFSFFAAGPSVRSKMPACLPAVSGDALVTDYIASFKILLLCLSTLHISQGNAEQDVQRWLPKN